MTIGGLGRDWEMRTRRLVPIICTIQVVLAATKHMATVVTLVLIKGGRYSIGIVLPTQNWTILEFPNIGFTSQYNTNTMKKVVDEEE